MIQWYIVGILIILLICIIFIILKSKNVFSKSLLILYIIILIVPFIIYCLDFNNVPSNIGLVNNVNSQSWLDYLSNYTASIVSATISSIISIYLVVYQIKENNEITLKREKETLRLQNLPILKYNIDRNR